MVQGSVGLSSLLDGSGVLLDRQSIVEKVATLIRSKIIARELKPGERLAEQQLTAALRVSRNTLREAFSILTHEGLLTRETNRGVTVRTLEELDVRDIYRTRRLLECVAVECSVTAPEELLVEVRDAVTRGRSCAQAGDWAEVGTADIRFHAAIAALACSRHVNDLMRGMMAELRLAFHVMEDLQSFHGPYLELNDEICTFLEQGEWRDAQALVREYLSKAEEQVVAAMSVDARY
jgi:DNA-binding GntR family transcriptional regulator